MEKIIDCCRNIEQISESLCVKSYSVFRPAVFSIVCVCVQIECQCGSVWQEALSWSPAAVREFWFTCSPPGGLLHASSSIHELLMCVWLPQEPPSYPPQNTKSTTKTINHPGPAGLWDKTLEPMTPLRTGCLGKAPPSTCIILHAEHWCIPAARALSVLSQHPKLWMRSCLSHPSVPAAAACQVCAVTYIMCVDVSVRACVSECVRAI